MIIPILVGIVGLMVGGRTKPLSKHSKNTMLGPTTGFQYKVEDMPDQAIVIVHAPDGTSVTFNRHPDTKRLIFKVARGNPGTVGMVRKDFEPIRLAAPAESA